MSKAVREKGVTPSALDIQLLGPFRVAVDNVTVEEHRWSRRQPKLLVKLLALEPHHQLHREQLLELLWPDANPEAAINNLHKVIHLARHALEPTLKSASDSNFIHTHAQQVVLRAPGRMEIDVERFEQSASRALKGDDVQAYEDALDLYKGDLLTEDPYEDWATTRREQLRIQYLDLLGNFARLFEKRGEFRRSIEQLKALTARDPSDEDAHRELMRLYAATRHKQQALRQYEECREALRKELDAEPEQATVALREQIVAGRIPTLPVASPRALQQSSAINSLAILPLVNVSGDPDFEYFSDGITESIINTLSQLPQLRVMARSTVFRYKGVEVDPQEVGSRLGVRAVLTGRVLHRGDALNIQTELVDVFDGSQVWGEKYNRKSMDIFMLQEEIAKEIAEKLRLRLSGEEKGRLTKRYTENMAAYQLYLKGRYFWNKRTVEALWKGVECFKQAIQIEPGYALAYAGISDCFAFLGDVGLTAMSSREAFSRAKDAAKQAIAIDEELAEAHLSLAHMNMHHFEWPEAEKEFKRAIELSPNHTIAHQWFANYLLFHGRDDEAIEEAGRALELDPLSLSANGDFAIMFYYTRRYDAAIEQYRKCLELEPNFYRFHLWLGWAYEQNRMYENAIAEFQKARTLSQESTETVAALGCVYSLSGQKDKALSILAELNALSPQEYVSPYNMALIYLSLGETNKAFDWLERAYEVRAEWMIYLGVDPRFDSVRTHPRFEALLRRIGFAT